MSTRTDWLPALLQNCDSIFPTGAYAHSSSLEEIVRLGWVRDEASLAEFLHLQILPQLQHFELPYLRFAFEAALAEDLPSLTEICHEIGAGKLSRETREASLQMGQARLHVAQMLAPDSFLVAFKETPAPKHLVAVFGVQMAQAGVPLAAALAGFVYQSLAGIGSAALKLIRIGQDGVQRVLYAALEKSDAAVIASQAIAREDAGWFNPVLDIASMRHEHAEERLFIS